MKRYEKYKDSGIDWLKEIPEHWGLNKLKYEVSLKNEKVSSQDSKLTYIGMENIESGTGRYIATDSEAEGLANYFTEGDILFGKLRPYLAKVFLAQTEGICSTEFLVFKCNESNSNHFFHKLLLSPNFIEVVNSSTYGAKMPRANSEFVNNLKVPVPSLSEQTAIATFLDHKTAQIDALIEKKEQLIEKLKRQRQAIINEAVTKGLNPNASMKDSGVEWLGKIPAHWEVVNFRYVIDILTDYTANGSFGDLAKNVTYLEEGYSRLIRLTDLREDLTNKGVYISEESHNYLSKSELFGGEVLLANVGAYSGLAWLMPRNVGKASLAPNMFLLKFKEQLNNEYAYNAMISDYLSSQFKIKAISAAQPKINKEDVRTCLFLLPPQEEQLSINSFIKEKEMGYNLLMYKLEQSVEKLKLYRQSLISEAVTGKIDVRDWETITTN
ncbi:type I restriction enzyme S subunit [Mangrovibacterium marinum]|uniref:Type I restriction enzyme S subunit n=1 Tax=Mangrovibacterium marinum TaxID=1639118 RepID=A0A2T5C3I3_9BACT|nr:restriction endonuclease subunit S [Mangrovibacterium marinum]PTN09305.1 type I restriction enzyme S subunit [Mangrovibacterium marinum]